MCRAQTGQGGTSSSNTGALEYGGGYPPKMSGSLPDLLPPVLPCPEMRV